MNKRVGLKVVVTVPVPGPHGTIWQRGEVDIHPGATDADVDEAVDAVKPIAARLRERLLDVPPLEAHIDLTTLFDDDVRQDPASTTVRRISYRDPAYNRGE